MNYLWLLVLLGSHLLCALPLWSRLRRGDTPAVVDFACLSFLLYYDLGIALEVFGVEYGSYFFVSWLHRPDPWGTAPFAILLFAPWALRLGALAANSPARDRERRASQVSEIRPDRARLFYGIALAVCAGCAFGCLELLLRNPLIWMASSQLLAALGPYYVLLALPSCLLAYFIRQQNISPAKRAAVVAVLLFCSVLSAIPVGERTGVLLPLVIVGLFYKPLSLRRVSAIAVTGALSASLLLPLFKPRQADNRDALDMVQTTVWSDFSRAQVLADAVDRSSAIGTRIMPFPGAGYVYSALLFVPRTLAPFKGYSTAVAYTAAVTETPDPETNWGLGLGVVEELALNFGVAAVLPGLLFYGIAMGWAEKLARSVPAAGIPLRLGAIWICGYHLPALLQVFGTMTVVVLILSRYFSTIHVRPAPSPA